MQRMTITETPIRGCVVLTLKPWPDDRGFFMELYNEGRYAQALGTKAIDLPREWPQVNFSRSRRNVVRGLHIAPFAKLVTCVKGEIYDVVVDCREDSPTYRKVAGWRLSETNGQQVYVPVDCAHGFMALADDNLVIYQQTATFESAKESSFHWRDNDLSIPWPHAEEYVVSEKDQKAPPPPWSE